MESAGDNNSSGSPEEILVEPRRQLGPGASEEVHPDESKQNVERGAEERKMEMDTQAAGDARTVLTLGRRFGAVYDDLSKEAKKLESELLESPDPQIEAKLAELKMKILYYAKLFYGDGKTSPLELKDIQRLADEQLKAGPIDDLEYEDRLYLETIAAGYKEHKSPIVATCDLESFCNAGKGVDALAEAEKIAAKALRFHEDRPGDANAAKAFLENPEEEVPFLAGQEGITMMSPLISCSIMLLKQKLGHSFRFISDKLEGDNLADTFILKPQAFVAHAPNGPDVKNDRIGFRVQDSAFIHTVKRLQQWNARHYGLMSRAKVYGAFLRWHQNSAGDYTRCPPRMKYWKRHNRLRQAILEIERRIRDGELENVKVGDENDFKEWYPAKMALADYALFRLSGDRQGKDMFRTSSDGKVIACTYRPGAQNAMQYAQSVEEVWRDTPKVVNMGRIWKKNFGRFDDYLKTLERMTFKVPKNINNDTPGGSVGAVFYQLLDECSLGDHKTFLPKSVLLTCVAKYLLFKNDERDFKTADDLLILTYEELKKILHICLVDAAVTMDNVSMMYGIMLDDVRYENMPNHLRYEELLSDAEGDSDAEEQSSSQDDDPELVTALEQSDADAAAADASNLAQALDASMEIA